MKKIIAFLMMLGCIALNAQNSADKFTTGSSDQARDPRVDQMNFVPNEVLVKFKDEVPLSNAVRLRSAGLSAVDKVLQANGIDSLVRLFPNTKSSLLRSTGVARIVKDPQGRDMKIPNLDKIYKITIPQLRSTSSVPVNIFQVIEDLKALSEVEYAEPNYIYSVDDLQPVGPVLTADDVKKMQTGIRSSQSAVVPNDPLYSQQWYIPAVKADLVWEQTTGDTTQMIGILDTGVDWNHPDLKNKIWTNPGEIPGNGIDDDGDGLIDDIRGWDYINNDNNPMDDNSHGTHVAGIAAAETNNGIGIAGVNWNAKIMAIKVFQSSGRGDAATITKGIIYAANHGATVINMSFGSYARSSVMEDALANAYATTLLVAAAGNDETSIGPNPPFLTAFYPAALSFVLGVQAPDGSFSNFDQDGPVFSDYSDLLNYEMKAPGTNIISTVPNGNYRVYQGTSMAAPIVSGSVSLYKSKHPDDSQELMWGNLINTIESFINIDSAINVIPKPKLMFVTKIITDTISGDDRDGMVDAGETIELSYTIRNTWGQCDSVMVGLQFVEFEDTSTAQIISPKSFIGSVSSYSTKTNKNNPIKIVINKDVANNRDIRFIASLWYPNSPDTIKQNITINVTNGEELSGILDSMLTLTPNKLWLINSSFRVGSNGILIVKPGVVIINNNGITNNGNIIAVGTPDNMITIKYGYITGIGTSIFKYVNFESNTQFGIMGKLYNSNFSFDFCKFSDFLSTNVFFSATNLNLSNSLIEGCTTYQGLFWCLDIPYFSIYNNVFDNSKLTSSYTFTSNRTINQIKLFKLNTFNRISRPLFQNQYTTLLGIDGNINTNINCKNNFIGFNNHDLGSFASTDIDYALAAYQSSNDFYYTPSQYWGSINLQKIKEENGYDFLMNSNYPMIKYDPILLAPSDSAHAIVWKVLVNGKDAQDEVVDPIGIGKQRFDVYFNRPMDKTITPQVGFGVRYPYNQQPVNEDGLWSEDGKIYTAYKTIKLTTGDGLNRIRVAGAKEINGWDWTIPVEDIRFNFVISAASSSSLDFMATPGLGKVKLEWNNNNLEDGLGYNMYRMEHINDSTLTAPVIINTSLINDTLYTDYSVVPNRKYYYTYKVVRTDLSETDPSKVVSAVPFTAAKGDANGDLSVNVLDITTIVAYLLNNNPQPFIAEAADFNSDGNINVLDIVGVVNNVLYGGLRFTNVAEDQQASLYLQNDTLFADASTAIGGLQFDVNGISSITDIQVLDALQVFESGYSQRDSTTLRLLYYSMSGKSIASGSRIPLLKIKKSCKLLNAIVSDKGGASIQVSLSDPTIGNRNGQGLSVAELGQNYPNPSKGQTTLPVQIFEKVDEAAVSIYNMLGQRVKVLKLDNPTVGKHEVQWNSLKDKGLFIYKLEIRSGGQQYVSPLKKMIVL